MPNGERKEELFHGLCVRSIITILILLFLGLSPFFLSPTSVNDIVSLEAGGFFIYFLLPIPFAYVAYLSYRRFRKESMIAFLFLPISLVLPEQRALFIFFGFAPLVASWQARNTFNGKNYFWTVYHSLSLVFALFAVIFAVDLAYSYGVNPAFQQEVEGVMLQQVGDAVNSFDLFPSLPGDGNQGSGFDIGSVIGEAFGGVELVVRQELSKTDPPLTDDQSTALSRGFTNAEALITEGLPVSNVDGGTSLDPAPYLKQYLKPSGPVQVLIFFLVFSTLGFFKFFLAFSGAVYGQVLKLVFPPETPYDDQKRAGDGEK